MRLVMIWALPLLLLLGAEPGAAALPLDPHQPARESHPSGVHKPIRYADADILPAGTPQEVTILYYLAIARGHLIASMELAKRGKLDQSVLHSRHALDEAWIELARFLPVEQSQSLRRRIEAMNEAIALKRPFPEMMAAHAEIESEIESLAASAFLPGEAGTEQALDLLILLLRQAAAEYEEAWDDLQLKDRAEYQDGFAFVAVAKTDFEAIAPRLRVLNPEAEAEIGNTIARIAGAWPSPEPPEKPVMGKPLLRALVTAVEINARQIRR